VIGLLLKFSLIVVAVTALVLLIIIGIARAVRAAKHSPAGVGAIGWALLFLTSGRMPPPPPPSQIEVDIAGKKDRNASRDIGDP
jgi:hypothetical protein